MIKNLTSLSINNPEYDFFTLDNFFGGSDNIIRLIIFIDVLLSFFLYLLIIITLCYYKKNREFSFLGFLTLNVFVVNFFLTVSYMLDWIVKDDQTETKLEKYSPPVNIGALVIGNPNNFKICIIQGFLLIFLSINQDTIINIFFSYIILGKKDIKSFFVLIYIFLGLVFPFIFTYFYYHFHIIGIDEKFCYVSKYIFEINNNIVKYKENKNYVFYKFSITLIRTLNFIFTIFLLIKAIYYIKTNDKNDKKREKLISTLPIVIITFFTLCIELIYRFGCLIITNFEFDYIGIYIVLSTLDSFMLPFAFLIKFNLFKLWFCSSKANDADDDNKFNDNDNSINDISIENILSDKKS